MNGDAPAGRAARTPIRILLCSPALVIDGGIPAVVRGLLAGMSGLPWLRVRLLTYGKFRRDSWRVFRMLRELAQIPLFAWRVIRWRPHIIQFESSFDRKTLVRDSVFVGLSHVLGAPVVLHVHGGQFHSMPSWPAAWQRWSRRFLQSCDAVVVASSRELELLRELCGRSHGCHVVPNPLVSGRRREPEDATRSASGEIRVVFAGRWIPQKGVLDAIEAMRYVTDRRVQLYVFGGGPLAAEVARLASDPGVRKCVTVMGYVSTEALSRHLAESDIFVFASSAPEGFPMAVFSAAASGMSIVTTAVSPIPDHMKQPDNCLWAAANDPRGLAAGIDRLAQDPALRRAQNDHNRKLADVFAPERVAMQLADLYRGLLQERAARNGSDLSSGQASEDAPVPL